MLRDRRVVAERLDRLNVHQVGEVAVMPVPLLRGLFGARGRVDSARREDGEIDAVAVVRVLDVVAEEDGGPVAAVSGIENPVIRLHRR